MKNLLILLVVVGGILFFASIPLLLVFVKAVGLSCPIAALCLQYRMDHLFDRDSAPHVATSKKRYGILIAAGVLDALWTLFDDFNKSRTAGDLRNELKEVRADLKGTREELKDARTQIMNLQTSQATEFQNLAVTFSTNSSTASAGIARLAYLHENYQKVNSDEVNLTNWQAEYKNLLDLRTAQQKESAKKAQQNTEDSNRILADQYNPYFGSALDTFRRYLTEIASKSGDSLFTDYTVLPSSYLSNLQHVATFYLTNAAWIFDVSVSKENSGLMNSPTLQITGRGSDVVYALGFPRMGGARPQQLPRFTSAQVAIRGQGPVFSERALSTNSTQMVEKSLRYLITAHPLSNKK